MTPAEEVSAVMAMLARHGIAEFEYEAEGVHMVLTPAGIVKDAVAPTPTRAKPQHETIAAPFAGLFLARHPLETADRPLPRRVRRDEIIGYLKVGPILRPVCAPVDGVIVRILVDAGMLAGYGAGLFSFQPAAQ
ncbi:MAG: hypothetical protein ACOH2J_21465 [Allorhizobium sp.]